MMFYRKKSVPFEAYQWIDGTCVDELTDSVKWPKWLVDAIWNKPVGKPGSISFNEEAQEWEIARQNGVAARIYSGDWISCHPDTGCLEISSSNGFARMYEPAYTTTGHPFVRDSDTDYVKKLEETVRGADEISRLIIDLKIKQWHWQKESLNPTMEMMQKQQSRRAPVFVKKETTFGTEPMDPVTPKTDDRIITELVEAARGIIETGSTYSLGCLETALANYDKGATSS